MPTNSMPNRTWLWYSLIALSGGNAVYLWLTYHHYYLVFYPSTGHIYPIVFNMLVLLVLAFRYKAYLLYIPPTLLLIYFLWHLLSVSLLSWTPVFMDSPERTERLIVSHRVAVHGESNYFYEIYQNIWQGVLWERLTEKPLHIIVRGEVHSDAIKALGMDQPHWESEKKVTFPTKDGLKTVILN